MHMQFRQFDLNLDFLIHGINSINLEIQFIVFHKVELTKSPRWDETSMLKINLP